MSIHIGNKWASIKPLECLVIIPAGYAEIETLISISFLAHLIVTFSGYGRVQGKDRLLEDSYSFSKPTRLFLYPYSLLNCNWRSRNFIP